MALNKDILGAALYAEFSAFNNKDIATLGNLETARLNFCKKLAEVVIEHIKDYGEGHLQPGTLKTVSNILITDSVPGNTSIKLS